INICSEFLRDRSVARPTPYRRYSIAKFLGKLNAEVAKPADALNSDKVTLARATVTKRVECGDSSAHKRRGFSWIEGFRHAGQSLHRRDHKLLVSAVIADSTDKSARTIREIPSHALRARTVLPPMPTDANMLPLLPPPHASSDLVDHTRDFVSG